MWKWAKKYGGAQKSSNLWSFQSEIIVKNGWKKLKNDENLSLKEIIYEFPAEL